MGNGTKKFKSIVQSGLFVIIFGLLLLSAASNYVIYNIWGNNRTETEIELKQAAVTISRNLTSYSKKELSDSLEIRFSKIYNLSNLVMVPSYPESDSDIDRRNWLLETAPQLPLHKLSKIAEQLIEAKFSTLNKGMDEEFFYLHPYISTTGKRVLILSKKMPVLAYMDSSIKKILFISIGSIFIILALYFYLSRFIVSPFERLKSEAVKAGRVIEGADDDVDMMVNDYEKIINELKDKESLLLELNESIQNRADRLENLNEYLMSSMISGVITLNNKGEILNSNNSVSHILAIDCDFFKGKDLSCLFDKNSKIYSFVSNAELIFPDKPYQEFEYVRSDNKKMMLGIGLSVIKDSKNNPLGFGVLITDVTELDSLRKELEDSNRLAAIGEMSAGLAHQLRNSMGAINGYANLIKRKLEKNNISSEQVEILKKESGEAEKLITRFLQYARPFDLNLEDVELKSYLTEIIGSFKNRSDCKLIEFDLCCETYLNLSIDSLFIKQALVNIIDNSIIAYKEKAGIIRIESVISTNYINIHIQDNAGGIADDVVSKIFTPFYSSRPSGTGLGLSLAQKIIDNHGGHLKVQSTVGEGAEFIISLPMSKTAIKSDLSLVTK